MLTAFLEMEEVYEPKIVLYPFGHDLGDMPDAHRWRAQWETGCDGTMYGIALSAYPVVKKTPCGAWVDPLGYYEATKQPWEDGAPACEWLASAPGSKGLKWVSDDASQSWAKPTKGDAVFSIAVRLTRWSQRLANDVEKATEAAKALRFIRPDLDLYAGKAEKTLRASFEKAAAAWPCPACVP